MPSLPSGTFPSTYDNSQYTSFERTPGAGYLTTVGSLPHGSTYFDGSGDYLTIANSQNFYNLGTADWTIEFWVYFTDVSVFNGIFQIGEDVGALSAMLYTDGKLKLLENDQAIVFESNRTFSANTWYHIVYTNDDSSNTQRLYVNGIAEANTGSKSTAYSFGNKTVYIGGRYFSGSFQRDMNGYISNFRIVGGSVVYPPASGGGSAYFDGTGDYIKTNTSTDLVIGTNSFTAECWIYPTTFATVSNVIDRRRSGDAASYDWTTYLTTSGEYAFYANGGTQITSSALSLDTWHHTAVVRNSGTTTLYVNGVSQGTYSDSNSYPSNQMTFGIYGPGLPGSESLPYTGYLSNFRLEIGTNASNGAVYTAAFTPPTSPLTSTSYTELMTFQNYTGSVSDEGPNGLTLTEGGNASSSYSSPFIESKSPLTAITNTQLLTCQNSTGAITDASSNSYTITANGNVTAHSSSDFSGSGGTPSTTSSFNLLGYNITNTSNTKLLICHNSVGSIADTSPSNHTITVNGDAAVNELNPFTASTTSGGSTLFDGTDDNLSVPSFVMGTNDYTIEMWIYPTAISNYYHLYDGRGGHSSTQDAILLQMTNTGTFRFYSKTFRISGSTQVSVNTWNHVVLERVGNINTIYLNGTSEGTYDDQGTSFVGPANNVGRIGCDDNEASNFFPGYISNFRIVIGSAVYNGNFTPSRSPLTAITNTQILTCQNSTGSITDASSNSHTITANGGAAADALTPFSSNLNGSTYFDGTGDYLLTPTSSDFTFGTGDFTVEHWFYTNNWATSQVIDGRMNGAGSSTNWCTYIESGKTYRFFAGGDQITSSALADNTWYHVALVRNSGTTTLYINGVSQGTYSDSNNYDSTQITVGIHGPNRSSYPYEGYISNLRVIKGTAVYTSAFTPSTNPLTTLYGSFTTGNIYNFGGGGLLTKVLTRDSQTSFAFNVGDSDNSTVGGSIKLLGGHDSANSLEKFSSGTIYNFGGGGLLTKVLTRDSQTSFAFNVGDSSKGTSGLPIRLLADDSANSLEQFSTGTVYTFEKTALNTILSTRTPLTGFGGNVGSLADSGGSVGGGGGGGGGGASSYEFVIIT